MSPATYPKHLSLQLSVSCLPRCSSSIQHTSFCYQGTSSIFSSIHSATLFACILIFLATPCENAFGFLATPYAHTPYAHTPYAHTPEHSTHTRPMHTRLSALRTHALCTHALCTHALALYAHTRPMHTRLSTLRTHIHTRTHTHTPYAHTPCTHV